MNFDLIVTADFGLYAKGERITDSAEVAEHFDSSNVVRVPKIAPTKPAKAD